MDNEGWTHLCWIGSRGQGNEWFPTRSEAMGFAEGILARMGTARIYANGALLEAVDILGIEELYRDGSAHYSASDLVNANKHPDHLPDVRNMVWRPIETAPKDGTFVIGYDQDVDVGVCLVQWMEPAPWYKKQHPNWSGDWQTGEGFCREIIAWMPLPTSPVIPTKQSENKE